METDEAVHPVVTILVATAVETIKVTRTQDGSWALSQDESET